MHHVPPSPSSLPALTPTQIFARLALLVVFCTAMIGVSIGARRLRDSLIHEPVCARVCGARGQRHDGVIQHRKSDAAAACVCVGPAGSRSEVPTRFFSEHAALDFLARELTSTMGVILAALLVGVGALVLFRALRPRVPPAPP